MPAAALGAENPLPHFRDAKPDMPVTVRDNVSEEDRKYMGWRNSFRVLPHRMQDDYGYELHERDYTAITLENEHIKAVILPEIGGRLASLVDKDSGIELLEPVKDFRPGNVALRNAWIAGGVEWNTAQLGHHYLTCAPMFAARVVGSKGEPALRLYAWERTKQFPYQLDFHLPPGAKFLFVRVRVINPHDEELPMYWWSNIAVPQQDGRRTLVPADDAITNLPDGFGVTDLPMVDDIDMSYATRIPYAKEFFFRVESEWPWIASLDSTGAGLVHASTARLKGRKMFVWGTSRGGQRWQEKLLGPGRAYLEIQGGVARTQLESLPMPAKAEWTWTEAYGLLKADPAKVHATDWRSARLATGAALEQMLTLEELNKIDAQLAEVTTRAPEAILFNGEGWGSLELMRDADGALAELPFAAELVGEDQCQWVTLLREGYLPERDVNDEPGHYMVQPEWRNMLEESIRRGVSDNWYGWLHLGVMRLENFDPEGAKAAWERSIEMKPSAWAYRNLAVLETRNENHEVACDLMAKAWETGPRVISLALEYADHLLKTERWETLRDLVADLPESMQSHERVLILSAKLALHFGDMSGVEEILSHEFATIREGEVTLTDLWFAWQAKLLADREGVTVDDELLARVKKEMTPPSRIDMRMGES